MKTLWFLRSNPDTLDLLISKYSAKGLLLIFEECKNSLEPNSKIHTHLFFTNHLGEPGGYKSSEKLDIDSAWEKWHELHQKGWTEVSHNYG